MSVFAIVYLVCMVINLVCAVIIVYKNYEAGEDFRLLDFLTCLLLVFTPVVNVIILVLALLGLGAMISKDLVEKFETVTILKGKK